MSNPFRVTGLTLEPDIIKRDGISKRMVRLINAQTTLFTESM